MFIVVLSTIALELASALFTLYIIDLYDEKRRKK